jgi:cytochrome c oxidase subunit 3
MANEFEYGTTGKPHPYHIVRPSIWPLVASIAGGLFAMGMVLFMHDAAISEMKIGPIVLGGGVLLILAVMFFWWKDIIFETVKEKVHNPVTEVGMRFGMSLFIASEVMFFFAFFWAFFNGAFFPTEAIGFQWPPASIHAVSAADLPLMMTTILLLSGCTVTWAHHAILEGDQKSAVHGLALSVLLGTVFLGFQAYEYAHMYHEGIGFGQSIYTSAFYMATGFHGFHVFVGTVFLAVCLFRAHKGHFKPDRHFGFEAAAWYWHFVDVVWLFLFVAVYVWGNEIGMDLSEAQDVILPAAEAAH